MDKNIENNEKQNQTKEPEKKKSHIGRNIGIIAVIIIILLLLLKCCGTEPSPGPTPTPSPTYTIGDTNVIQEEDDLATRQEKLNRQVEEGMITISMNLTPVFKDGRSDGNLMIVNDAGNRYPQVIKIYSGEDLIYESPGIQVGHEIQSDKLKVDLKKGTYDCTAYFIAFNPDSGSEVGRAAANINITVQN